MVVELLSKRAHKPELKMHLTNALVSKGKRKLIEALHPRLPVRIRHLPPFDMIINMRRKYLVRSDFPKELVCQTIKSLKQLLEKEQDNLGVRTKKTLIQRLKSWEEELERIVYFENRNQN